LEIQNKGHLTRINKRIDKIETELETLGVDVSKLKNNEDEDLLRDITSEDGSNEGESDENSDINEYSEISDENTNYKKTSTNKVKKIPTMEEKKVKINERSSKVVYDFANEDPEEVLEKRKKEYINAIEYLKKNNLSKDQKAIFAILEKAELVKNLQKRDDVDLLDIPAPVIPDELFGMTSAERSKKYQVIINIVNKTINNLKIIGSNNHKVYNSTKNKIAKENYEKSIFLFKKQTQLKADLLKLFKNRWQPIPELQSTVENFPNPAGADFSEGEVVIKMNIPEDFQNVGKYYYKFKWMDDEENLKKIKVKNSGEVVEKGYAIDFGHHKRFSSLKVVIKISQWRCGFFDKTLFAWGTNLSQIKKGQIIKKSFKFDDKKFYVTVFSDLQSEEGLEEIKLIDTTYIAPPFKSASGGSPEKFRKTSVTRRATIREASVKAHSKNDIPIPEGIGADEIKEPDVQRNLWSCYYCKLQSEKFQKIVNSAIKKGKTADNMIQTKMLLFQSQMAGIQSAIENEQVSFDQYMGYLKKGVAHDKILLKYFEDIGDKPKASLVRFRIE